MSLSHGFIIIGIVTLVVGVITDLPGMIGLAVIVGLVPYLIFSGMDNFLYNEYKEKVK
jgi:hypothetical protein